MEDDFSLFKRRYIISFLVFLGSLFFPYTFDIKRGWIRAFSKQSHYGFLLRYGYMLPNPIEYLLFLIRWVAFIIIFASVFNVNSKKILTAKKTGRLGLLLYAPFFIALILGNIIKNFYKFNSFFNIGFFLGIGSWIGLCILHFNYYKANKELVQKLTLEKQEKKREEIQNSAFCTNCGAIVKVDSRTCHSCEVDLSQFPPTKTPKRSHWGERLIGIGISTIIVTFFLPSVPGAGLAFFGGIITFFMGIVIYIADKLYYRNYV